jgi:hypothetical protein
MVATWQLSPVFQAIPDWSGVLPFCKCPVERADTWYADFRRYLLDGQAGSKEKMRRVFQPDAGHHLFRRQTYLGLKQMTKVRRLPACQAIGIP